MGRDAIRAAIAQKKRIRLFTETIARGQMKERASLFASLEPLGVPVSAPGGRGLLGCDDLGVLSLVVILELGVGHQLVDQRLLTLLARHAAAVEVGCAVYHLTHLRRHEKKYSVKLGHRYPSNVRNYIDSIRSSKQ